MSNIQRFIIKLSLFAIPILGLNFLLISLGFRYTEKNSYIIKKLANQDVEKGAINFIFLGTSRTDCAIDPQAFENTFKSMGINAHAINLGIDGANAYLGLRLAGDKIKHYDYAVIEVFPGNPIKKESPLLKEESPAAKANSFLSYYSNKMFVLQKGYSLFMFANKRIPVFYSYSHTNGFFELKQNNNPVAIQKEKNKWAGYMERAAEDTATFFQAYMEYTDFIRHTFSGAKTRLIFLVMPVDGESRYYQQKLFDRENTVTILKTAFPTAVFISSQQVPSLSTVKTFEDSHLDGQNASVYSRKLANLFASDSTLNIRRSE